MRSVRLLALLGCLALWAGSEVAEGGSPRRAAWRPSRALVLKHGDIVEGSLRVGGLQPSYEIDLGNPTMRAFLGKAKRIGKGKGDVWTKVAKIRALVQDSLPRREYTDPSYRQLLETYRESGRSIPIGAYLKTGAGVCREHNMLTHLALNAAGIANHYVYAKVEHDGHQEDHGFVVLRNQGNAFIVDSYFSAFDGQSLADARASEARLPRDSRIVEIHPFPTVSSAE